MVRKFKLKTGKKHNSSASVAAVERSVGALAAAVNDWQENEYKASETRLYQLLQDTYGVFKLYDTDAAAWGKVLSAYLVQQGRVFSPKMSLMGKIVRAVFDEHKQDVTPLIGVLNIANKSKVTEDNLAAWIEQNGGIWQIRRNKPLTGSEKQRISRGDLIIKAERGCKTLPVQAVVNVTAVQSIKDFAVDSHGTFSVALAIKVNGQLKIIHYTEATGLVNEYLERMGRAMPELSAAEMAAAANEDDRRLKEVNSMMAA
ncbi:hypothetical protein [Falsiroseomonas sp.]|uniref:hypothetical protein n=1 Tax=Falsiroseomonas sp. TaxID=2870721 RepID=UPI003F6FBAE8